MDTVKKIKAILARKAQLEDNTSNSERAFNHVDMSDLVTFWTGSNGRIDVRMSRDSVKQLLAVQISADKAELATIDKQLDAIGALMGAGNV